MPDVQALLQERTSIFKDVFFHNRIPARVPVSLSLPFEPVAQFGELDLVEAQWNPALIEEAADRLCRTLYSDTCPFGGSIRYPSIYQTLDSKSFIMASNGFIQHPEVVGMLPEEYDYLIEKPYDCLLERILPRQYGGLDVGDPFNMAINFAKSLLGSRNDILTSGTISRKLSEKYGYYTGGLRTGGFSSAPFDFLADQLRGFKGISMDVRRMPEKVAEACEALYPIVFKKGLPQTITDESTVFLPLHMPTFMRELDFARLWWPSFKRMVDEYASLGIHATLYCEDDWTRYLDYLYELPIDTVLMFEYGNMKSIKEKLGGKFVIAGLYPITTLKTHTKEQCVDKAKEMVDLLAPGGKYIFSLDKRPLFISDIKLENLCAVAEYVRDKAIYPNPGETAGMKFNKDDYRVDPSARRTIDSKYYRTWAQFKSHHPDVSDAAAARLQEQEEIVFQYLIFLLL